MNEVSPNQGRPTLVARADFQYRWRVYALFVLVFGYGLWSAWDGFYKWPAQNAHNAQLQQQGQVPPEANHSEADLLINQILGIVLPCLSLALFIWLMYRSRGEYRLADGVLHVPGHEALPLQRIQSLDKSRWDRKGHAIVNYTASDGRSESLVLRDMVYQRSVTDQIVAEIEKSLASPQSAPPATPAPS